MDTFTVISLTVAGTLSLVAIVREVQLRNTPYEREKRRQKRIAEYRRKKYSNQ